MTCLAALRYCGIDPSSLLLECPAKRKRATLKRDPPRDTRMGWRRISVQRGGLLASPLSFGRARIIRS
jgi:hypothetical protein